MSWQASANDFNGDGWPDVLLAPHFQAPARLMRNDKGHFTEVNVGTFVQKDRHSCAWEDVNLDGRQDMYCSVGADFGTGAGENELWIQKPDGGFTDEAARYGVTDPFGRGRDVAFLDVNHDAYPDLFVGNRSPRPDGLPSPNRLYMNVGGTLFRAAPDMGVDQEVGGECVQVGDVDGDGWVDLLICSNAGLRFYHNDAGGRFSDQTAAAGISSNWERAALVDLDGDGRLDLALLTYRQVATQLQKNGVFQPAVVQRRLRGGIALAAGDVDNDGLTDLYVVQSSPTANTPDLMLLNGGTGVSFRETTVPTTSAGRGEAVSEMDFNRDGSSDFVVTNGFGTFDGPVQLITFPRCTIVGTAGGERLLGTANSDVMCAAGGNDTIHGGGGDDILDGGPGNDAISGGPGNDAISGGPGNDTLTGGPGNDHSWGGTDDDYFREFAVGAAGLGDDAMECGSGTDTVNYFGRVTPPIVTRDGWSNDGEIGERDNVSPDTEAVLSATVLEPGTIDVKGWQASGITGTTHQLTATVRDRQDRPMADVMVWYRVTGVNTNHWSGRTDDSGSVTLPYRGQRAGVDTVRLFADANVNGMADSGEPQVVFQTTWS